MVNKIRLIKLTQKLLSIDSRNPPGDEFKIANFVSGYLKKIGLKVKVYAFKRRRLNVLAYLLNKNSAHSLLVTPHLDTVPAGIGWSRSPLRGTLLGGRIYGLGATDCKGNLACAMEAINSIIEEKKVLGYNLIFAATADEECGSGLGLIPLLDRNLLKADAAVVLDADDFNIIVAQKGLMHLKVKIQGVRAHGAYPWRGENAIDAAIDIIKEIRSRKFNFRKNKYLHPPTINTGTIRGGDKVNIVADWCEFELDFRFLPGMFAKALLRELKTVIKKHTKKFKIEVESIQQPYLIRETHPLVFGLKKAMCSLNREAHLSGSEGATVITFFQHKNIPAVATGFGVNGCAHAKDEYAQIDNLYKGAQALERFLTSYKIKE
ncbi:MAG: M20 family metallopeptidase [Candidatus Omnitrophota bacterium]|jgi:succinyl-diaminopimelate desuccinylase